MLPDRLSLLSFFGMKTSSEALLSNDWPISAEDKVALRRISLLLKAWHYSLHE